VASRCYLISNNVEAQGRKGQTKPNNFKEVMVNEEGTRPVLASLERLGNSYHVMDHFNIKENVMSKEKAVKVSETKSTELLKVPAYSEGKLTGWAQVTVFKLSEAGIAAAKTQLTQSDVADLNRQKITDAKNNLRRGTSMLAALRQLVKVNPDLEKIVSLLVVKAAEGKFDAKTLKAIEDSVLNKK